jgi:hypothetical protein
MAITWDATESEPVEPFRTAHDALRGICFRLTADGEFSADDSWVVEGRDLAELAPELQISIDKGSLVENSGIDRGELTVSLVVRDRKLNLFSRLCSWSLDDLPSKAYPLRDALSDLSGSERTDIAIVVTPRSSRSRGADVASQQHHVVADKTFKLRVLSKRSKFPKRWATPDEFDSRGLPRNSIFWIDWLSEDLDRPASDAFIVWLNEDYKEQIKSYQLGGSSGRLLSVDLSSMILSEIMAAVLANDQEATDPAGTIRLVGDLMAEESGMTLTEMRSRFERPDGFSLARIWAQQAIDTPSHLKGLNFLKS